MTHDSAKHVDAARLWQRHEAMAKLGGTPKGGVNRQALTDEDIEARVLLRRWAEEMGVEFAVDDIANVFLRLPGEAPDLSPVITGSHTDSQPTGGRFDGIYGVLAGVEALQAIVESGVRPKRSIEVVGWTNEEGTRFVHSLMGSEAFAYPDRLPDLLEIADDAGITVEAAVARTLQALPDARRRPLGGAVAAYVEAHIEQGPILEDKGKQVGVVTGIQGWRRFKVRIDGVPGHAGTQPHRLRKDALRAAVAAVAELGRLMEDPDDVVRFTIGRFDVHPGSLAVIPERVDFTIDFRHPDSDTLTRQGDRIEPLIRASAAPCEAMVSEISRQEPIAFTGAVYDAVLQSAEALGEAHMSIYSGAGHDAQHMYRVCPTGMIFIPCEKGISHNEAENAKPEDLAAGARVLSETLIALANAE